jgi:hypothetical protein
MFCVPIHGGGEGNKKKKTHNFVIGNILLSLKNSLNILYSVAQSNLGLKNAAKRKYQVGSKNKCHKKQTNKQKKANLFCPSWVVRDSMKNNGNLPSLSNLIFLLKCLDATSSWKISKLKSHDMPCFVN